MRTCTHLLALALSLLFAQTLRAAVDLDHDHLQLRIDPQLTLAQLIDQTFARTPDLGELESRVAVAAAWQRRASNWLSMAPMLSMRYQTGRFNETADVEEFEAGISLPLWRWGERSATRALARSLAAETRSARALLRWRVAGAVRDALWRLAATDSDLATSVRVLTLAEEIKAKVERAHELGEVALGDVLIVRSNALRAGNAVIEQEAAVQDAMRTFAVLTQDSVRPDLTPEVRSASIELSSTHVLLDALNGQIKRAEAERVRVAKAGRGSPTLLIGPRREQAPGDLQAFNSIGLTLSVPLAGSAFNGPQVAAAGQVLAELVAERDRQQRALELMFHEAAHELAVIDQQLAAATQGAAVARQQITMANSAFEAGELNLLDLLQIQNAAIADLRVAEQLAVARHHAVARYNQALGETP